MIYHPVVPFGGNAGWAFLARTRETQQAAFNRSAVVTRDTEYFERTIGTVTSAEALVADRRLLRVALGAFGLDAAIDNKFFLRKVLEGSTLQGSLAAKLSDKRYAALSDAFGFATPFPRTRLSSFGKEITGAFRQRQFEVAVGQADNSMRLALNLQRDLKQVAEKGSSENAKWFTIMAQPPLPRGFRDRVQPAEGGGDARRGPPARHLQAQGAGDVRVVRSKAVRRPRTDGTAHPALLQPVAACRERRRGVGRFDRLDAAPVNAAPGLSAAAPRMTSG